MLSQSRHSINKWFWKKKRKNGRKNKMKTKGEESKWKGRKGRIERKEERKKRKKKLPSGPILLQCMLLSEDEVARASETNSWGRLVWGQKLMMKMLNQVPSRVSVPFSSSPPYLSFLTIFLLCSSKTLKINTVYLALIRGGCPSCPALCSIFDGLNTNTNSC